MKKSKLAVIVLGDGRTEFYSKRENIVRDEMEKIRNVLGEKYDLYQPEPVFDIAQAQACVEEIRCRRISSVIIHIPIWGTPSLAPRIAAATSLPVVLLSNRRPDSSSLVSMLAAAGMLEQSGKAIIRVWEEIDSPQAIKRIDGYVTACSVVDRLAASSYGLIGGRSIGIGTAVSDPAQWQQLFGIESDHCDQLEIMYRAERIPATDVNCYLDWLRKGVGLISHEGLFTADSLVRQVKSYLAVKQLVAEKKYDFIGLKCQQEMSDYYAVQCLGVALLNNDWDADGQKEPVPCSCEADSDGALTMRILQLCNGNKPTSLVDIRCYDQESGEFLFANCGAMAFHFADPQNPQNALRQVHLLPHVFGKAGGGATQFVCAPGKATAARLFRKDGRYYMGVFQGEIVSKPREELRKTTYCYPHVFLAADIDFDLFVQTMGSNHMHVVYGDYSETLRLFCQMKDISFISYNR